MRPDSQFMVMELFGPNLSTIHNSDNYSKPTLEDIFNVGIEILKTIKDIHELGYIHNDVKPRNILI